MIKISDKIWWVSKPDHEDNLAYMAQYDETKEGSPTASVTKMMGTGRSWARVGAQTVYKREDGKKHTYLYDENNRPVIDYVIPAKEGVE